MSTTSSSEIHLSGPVITSQDAWVHPRNVRYLAPIALVCVLLSEFVFTKSSMHGFCLGVALAMLIGLTASSFRQGQRS